MQKNRKVKVVLKFYKNNHLVNYSHKTIRAKYIEVLTNIIARNLNKWNNAKCRVIYDNNLEYFNEFEFNSLEDFVEKYYPFFEKELLEIYCNNE